ncbi:MAG: DUF4332 domain-containing protein [Fodinibius sp.]|nr:DUF4332 domain-containing protein [Fodinibius sp.]
MLTAPLYPSTKIPTPWQNLPISKSIGSANSQKLKMAGISSLTKLLKNGSKKEGRKQIAQKSGISENQILEWVNRADLTRVKGVNTQYADLLEHAGIDSIPELAQRNADKSLPDDDANKRCEEDCKKTAIGFSTKKLDCPGQKTSTHNYLLISHSQKFKRSFQSLLYPQFNILRSC